MGSRFCQSKAAYKVLWFFNAMLALALFQGNFAHGAEKVRIALSVRNVVFLPFYYAKEMKIYEKYGLDVELIQIRSDLQLAGIVSGEVDYTPAGWTRDPSSRQRFAGKSGRGSLQGAALFSRKPGKGGERKRT
jgi:ABC-type nitrate/sulfonate/bicarbonate transport system substrate-binding protein